MRALILFLTLSLYITLQAYAQLEAPSFPGYYITNTGDTVHARFYSQPYYDLQQRVFFKDAANNVKSFRPGQIRAFYAKSPKRTLFYVTFEGRFVRQVVGGPLSLVYYIMSGANNYSTVRAKKFLLINDTMIGDIYALSFRKDVLPFIKDYPELAAKVESRELKQKHLEEIVRQYNLWVEEKKKANTQQQPSNN